jgi:hypothetical protein
MRLKKVVASAVRIMEAIENGSQLPTNGKNYSAYSDIGVMTGRNYVHSKVYKVVVDAYAMLETLEGRCAVCRVLSKHLLGKSAFKCASYLSLSYASGHSLGRLAK